ncbi:MAG: hypothetical protein ACI81R_002043 [Bradymonadia bacterium]|jgi:hypothetical protein
MFFPMRMGDAVTLVVLLLFSLLAFLPLWGDGRPGGVAPLAWCMAALMVLSPCIALVRLATSRGGEE